MEEAQSPTGLTSEQSAHRLGVGALWWWSLLLVADALSIVLGVDLEPWYINAPAALGAACTLLYTYMRVVDAMRVHRRTGAVYAILWMGGLGLLALLAYVRLIVGDRTRP